MKVSFHLDGGDVTVDQPWTRSLLAVLRETLDCMSAKPGCEIGRCGACTILLDGAPVAACLAPVGRLEGASVLTAEGLRPEIAQPLLAIMREERLVQCGYCANGLLVLLAWIVDRDGAMDEEEAVRMLAGHLCRCAGHIGLRRALGRVLALRGAPPARG